MKQMNTVSCALLVKSVKTSTCICQGNLSASQFGGRINKNNLPLLALKRQQKSFVMSLRQLQKQVQLFS